MNGVGKKNLLSLLICLSASLSFANTPQPERWRWSNPSPHGNNVMDMNVGTDVSVQVGDAGSIHVQRSDGRWAPVNTGSDNYIRSTAMLDDRIIVTGESGLILWSDDGVDFHPSELSPANNADWFEGVCASVVRAVAVGDYGAIYTSTNGVQWTEATSGTTEWLRGVAFGGSAFVAVGENGTILTAPMSAASWSESASETGVHLNRVRYLGGSSSGAFYAVGNNGTLLKSPNGSVWTSLPSGSTNDLYDVALNNSGLLVVGDQEIRLSSDDGTSWSDQILGLSSNAPPAWTYLSAYGKGSAWMVAGRSGLLMEGALSSGNNYSWTASPSDSSHAWLWDMTELNGIRVAVGDLATIQTSLDGILWAREAVPVPSTNTVLLGVGGTTNLLVAVGNAGNILISEAGLSEVSVTNEIGSTNILVETFGVVWTNLPAFTEESLQGIDATDSLFITCGGNGGLYTSPDGSNWTLQITPTTAFLSSVAIGSNSCVAVGAGGTMLRGSTDGTLWSAVGPGGDYWIYRVRWLDNQFMAVGENGIILTSSNGSSWTARTSGTTKWLTDVAFLDGQWYVTGYQGTLLTSSDLVTWTTLSIPSGKSLFAANASDGQLLIAGVEGVILRNQVVADITPVQLLDYSHSFSSDTKGVSSIYEVMLFGGQPDQFFSFNSCTNLTDGSWANVNGTLELYDPSGTLYAIRTRDATNAPTAEFYTTELIP